MAKFKISLIIILVSNTVSIYAQYSGLSNFLYDSVLRSSIKANRVLKVTETIKDSTTRNQGFYLFDKKGRVVEMNTAAGRGFYRQTFQYNTAGFLTAQKNYEFSDTTKVEHWKNITLDKENRVLKEEKGQVYGGKVLQGVALKAEYSKTASGRKEVRYKRYIDYRTNPSKSGFGYDSVSGIFHFEINYEISGELRDHEDVRFGTKTVTRTYTLNQCAYSDVLTYKSYGSQASLTKIESTYSLLDKKGNTLEYGTIDYTEAHMDYAQEHPDDYIPGVFSPGFEKAFFQLKIKGEKKIEVTFKYDAFGHISEKFESGYHYTFKLDKNGRQLEQMVEHEKYDTSKLVVTYDAKGLVLKHVLTSWNPREKDSKKEITECLYQYTYY